MMLMRTDRNRELDRIAQQVFGIGGVLCPPVGHADRCLAEGDSFPVEFDLPGGDPGSIDLDVEHNVGDREGRTSAGGKRRRAGSLTSGSRQAVTLLSRSSAALWRPLGMRPPKGSTSGLQARRRETNWEQLSLRSPELAATIDHRSGVGMIDISVVGALSEADYGPSSSVTCTSALCDKRPAVLVSWAANPEGLPFCLECASKLEAHGDRVRPLANRR
jgi:hypothetical protein